MGAVSVGVTERGCNDPIKDVSGVGESTAGGFGSGEGWREPKDDLFL